MSWLKQAQDRPLFPEIVWSRPENKRFAGKLLIVGGNQYSFKMPAEAFAAANQGGVGNCRIILPDSLRKPLAQLLPEADFLPDTPSGSFAQLGLSSVLDAAKWADAVMLAGDFGHNSETAILLSSFMQKNKGMTILTGDSVDYFFKDPDLILDRSTTCIISDLPRLQKLLTPRLLLKQAAHLQLLVEQLALLTNEIAACFVTCHDGQVIVACNGQVSTTPKTKISWPALAGNAAVLWLQNPNKPFEALTTSVL